VFTARYGLDLSTRPGLAETVHVVYSANTPNTENNQIYLNVADKDGDLRQRTDPQSRQKARLMMTNSRFQYIDLHRARSPRKGSIPGLTDRTNDRPTVCCRPSLCFTKSTSGHSMGICGAVNLICNNKYSASHYSPSPLRLQRSSHSVSLSLSLK